MSVLEDLREMIAGIVGEEIPKLALTGPHSYRVVAVRPDGRCDLEAMKKGPPATIPNVDHWANSGGGSKPREGSIVVVSFLDGEKNAPMIGGYQPLRVAGGIPDQVTLDGGIVRVGPSSTLVELAKGPLDIASPVARVGDSVDCGFLTVAMVAGVPTLQSAPGPASATVVAVTGTITTGSGKVTSG